MHAQRTAEFWIAQANPGAAIDLDVTEYPAR
jgi:hypothetical protein